MNTRENTVIIVCTKHAWITVHDGEIIEEIKLEEGSPLMSYQSVYPKYNVVQLSQGTLKSKVLKSVESYFNSLPKPKKVSQPEEVVTKTVNKMSPSRRERRKTKKEQAKQQPKVTVIPQPKTVETVKKVVLDAVVIEQPIVNPIEEIQEIEEMMAPGPMNVVKESSTINNLKQEVMNKGEKAVVVTRVRTAKLLNLGVDVGYFALKGAADLFNYGGSTLVKAVGQYEQSVQEIMENRTKMADHYQELILESPSKVKEYTADHFTKMKEAREAKNAEKLAAMRTA